MARLIGSFLLSITLLTGCTNNARQGSAPGQSGVKVDAPGVKVDVEKGKGIQVDVAPK